MFNYSHIFTLQSDCFSVQPKLNFVDSLPDSQIVLENQLRKKHVSPRSIRIQQIKQRGINAVLLVQIQIYQFEQGRSMSYRLDPSTGRFVMTTERTVWPNRIDDPTIRQLSETSSPTVRSQLAQGELNKFFSSSLGGSMTPQTQNERIYIPSRSFVGEHAKNSDPASKMETTKSLIREESIGGTRRILLGNGRIEEAVERTSGNGPLSQREPKDFGATITRDMGTALQARIIRDGATTPNLRSLIRESMLPVRQFSATADSQLDQKRIMELESQLKMLSEQNVLLANDAELLKGELQNLRENNNNMQVELGSLREMHNDHIKLRQEADMLFDQNTALKNELSLLNSEIEHSNVLKLENAALLALQEQNSNLRSELGALQNLHHENTVLEGQLAGLRELQQENGNLRTEVSNLRGLQNENNHLKSELISAETQLNLLQTELNEIKSGDKDQEMRQFTENLTMQLQRFQADITSYEALKRNIEGKFGLNETISVDDFAEKIYLMLADNVGMMDEMRMKDSQLEEFREKMEQNQKAIEQLSSFRVGYEENFRAINLVHETERQKMLDLAQQLEQHKMQLKKANEEIARLESKKNPLEDEATIGLIKNKDAEITKLQVNLKTATSKCERLQKQFQQLKVSSEQKLTTDTKQLSQNLNSEIAQLSAELDKTRSDCATLQDMVAQRDTVITELSQQLERLRAHVHDTTEALQATTVDLRRMSQLYNIKDKETLNAKLTAEQVRADNLEMTRKLEEEVDQLKLKMEELHLEHRHQEESMLLELEDVRGNWHHRLFRELRTFDEALKEQIEQLNILKAKVTQKDDKILQMRDSLFTAQANVTALRSELQIEKLKSISERKTQSVASEVEMQTLKNDLNTANKLSDVLGNKMKQLVEDCKKKDEFIQKYVMGKKLSQEDKFNAQLFFKQYEILVPHANMKTKYEQELRLIDQLQQNNRILAKELAALRKVEPAQAL